MNIKLMLGLGCNMKCSYCYQLNSHDNTKIMSKEILKVIFDKLEKHADENHSILFFGGEPLLYIENIKYFINLLKTSKKTYNLNMTTNAYDRKSFYEIEVLWGKPIYNLLSNKEHKDYRKLNEYSLFRWVCTKENIKELDEDLIKFLSEEYGYKINFKYDMTEKWENEDINTLNNIKKTFKKYLKDFEMEYPINYNSVKVCTAQKELAINYDGSFISCGRNLSLKSNKNIFNSDLMTFGIPKCMAMSTYNFNNLVNVSYEDNLYFSIFIDS